MEMNMESAAVEDVNITEILGLATWDRPRETQELRNFVARRAAAIALDDVELAA